MAVRACVIAASLRLPRAARVQPKAMPQRTASSVLPCCCADVPLGPMVLNALNASSNGLQGVAP